jgi:hypothetical protein
VYWPPCWACYKEMRVVQEEARGQRGRCCGRWLVLQDCEKIPSLRFVCFVLLVSLCRIGIDLILQRLTHFHIQSNPSTAHTFAGKRDKKSLERSSLNSSTFSSCTCFTTHTTPHVISCPVPCGEGNNKEEVSQELRKDDCPSWE